MRAVHKAPWRDYFALTKPRVVALIVLTSIVGTLLATPGFPPLEALLFGNLGIALAAGSAATINHVLDRQIDARMARTRGRPLPTGALNYRQALIFAAVLAGASMLILLLLVNTLTAALTFASLIGYAVVYTLWLKRATPQNIVIGGAAGAIPPLVGWAAATGQLDLTAFALFGVIFFWTPPHFWALAQVIKADYARARIPMLPVVSGEGAAKRQSVVYAVLTALVSVVPFFTASAGAVYLAGAMVLGVGLVGLTVLDLSGRRWTRRLFAYSLVYVALLFGLFAVSPFLP
jgi:protoheme IX farnesyltransferase